MDSELIQTTSPEIKCSICLIEDIEDSSLCLTDCSHQFCKDCLDEWLDQKKITCPMCRSEIKYFNYQDSMNRIVKLNTGGGNLQLISMLYSYIKVYKITVYFLFIYGLYTTYNLYYYRGLISLYREEIDDCLKNQTDNYSFINDLNNEIKLLNNELVDQDPSNDKSHFSLVELIINHNIFSCLIPEYLVDKCISSIPQ
tara:strand:- start:724 stop:1317 length:594 start_codon:yes stop_codon:yes gene_type:complete